jgi:hypothetical protein
VAALDVAQVRHDHITGPDEPPAGILLAVMLAEAAAGALFTLGFEAEPGTARQPGHVTPDLNRAESVHARTDEPGRAAAGEYPIALIVL